jgi:hypothetical protein
MEPGTIASYASLEAMAISNTIGIRPIVLMVGFVRHTTGGRAPAVWRSNRRPPVYHRSNALMDDGLAPPK